MFALIRLQPRLMILTVPYNRVKSHAGSSFAEPSGGSMNPGSLGQNRISTNSFSSPLGRKIHGWHFDIKMALDVMHQMTQLNSKKRDDRVKQT